MPTSSREDFVNGLLNMMGDAWSLSGAGTIAVDGDVVKPNLAIRAIVAPRIVSQFLNDTGGVKWTGGNLNADVHISGDNVKRVIIEGKFEANEACLERGELILKACGEPFQGEGRVSYDIGRDKARLTLDKLTLGPHQLLRKAQAERSGGQWLANVQSTDLPWPWLAQRLQLKLPDGGGGTMAFDATIIGEEIGATLKANKATLPSQVGAQGTLTGTVRFAADALTIAGDIALTEPRIINGHIEGEIAKPLSEEPETELTITAADVDGRAKWPTAVRRSQGNANLDDVNAWLSQIPEPEIPGIGIVTLKLPRMRVGDKDEDLVDGEGLLTWAPLTRRLDLQVARQGKLVGLLRMTGNRTDPIEPLLIEAAFAARNLPIPLIASWLGQPGLFADGLGSVRGRIKTRWGLPLRYLKGNIDLAAKEVKLGTSDVGAKFMFQAGLPDIAELLTGGGEALTANEIRFVARFQQGDLNVRTLYLTSPLVDLFGSGRLDLADGSLNGDVVIRPLQQSASAISKVPLLGYLVAGREATLLELTWRISGHVERPSLSKAPELDTGKGLLGAMRRFNELPGLLLDLARDDDE